MQHPARNINNNFQNITSDDRDGHRHRERGRSPSRTPSFPSFRNVDVGTFRGLARPSSIRLEPSFPRLIGRNLPFHQSKNKVDIHHGHSRNDLYRLLKYNWFHVFLRLKTYKSVFILLVLWTSLILIFAGLYRVVDRSDPDVDCGLGNTVGVPMSFHTAFAFSLETCTTVGYGLPGATNAFFENCPAVQVVIYFQMTISMLFNAFLFSFMFARLAKSESRAVQVVFSDKMVVRFTERGTIVWQFRVYDVDQGHGIVEAHVRMYALLKHKDEDGHPQLVQLRIVSPDDELGSVLFLNIPTVVTHEMDSYSPLYPDDSDSSDGGAAAAKYRLSSGGLLLRQVDSVTGSRDEIMCPVCGETYGTFHRLRKHVRYQQMVEKKDDYPIKGSHRELELLDDDDGHDYDSNVVVDSTFVNGSCNSKAGREYDDNNKTCIPTRTPRPTLEQVQAKLPLQELICVVEGIDPLTSGTFQALQSYMPQDIEWAARFVPCLTSTTALSATFVDLNKFHQVECAKKIIPPAAAAANKKKQDNFAGDDGDGRGGMCDAAGGAVEKKEDEVEDEEEIQRQGGEEIAMGGVPTSSSDTGASVEGEGGDEYGGGGGVCSVSMEKVQTQQVTRRVHSSTTEEMYSGSEQV